MVFVRLYSTERIVAYIREKNRLCRVGGGRQWEMTRHKFLELETLLKWKGVQVSKMGDKAGRRALYKQFVEEGGGGDETACAWTDADEDELEALKNAPIKMADTSYGSYEAKQERNVVRACRKMMPEKGGRISVE